MLMTGQKHDDKCRVDVRRVKKRNQSGNIHRSKKGPRFREKVKTVQHRPEKPDIAKPEQRNGDRMEK